MMCVDRVVAGLVTAAVGKFMGRIRLGSIISAGGAFSRGDDYPSKALG